MKPRYGRGGRQIAAAAAWILAAGAAGLVAAEEKPAPAAPKAPPASEGKTLDWPYSGMPEAWLPWHLRPQPVAGPEKPKELRSPAIDKVRRETPVEMLADPLDIGGNDTLYGALLIPTLREGRCLPEGVGELQIRFQMDGVKLDPDPAPAFVRLDGRFSEGAIRYRHGVVDGLELYGELIGSGWKANKDLFLVEKNYQPLIVDQDLAGPIVTNLVLGGKLNLWMPPRGDIAIAGALDVKIPLAGSDELATSGGADVALSLLVSWRVKPVVLHANLGGVFTGRQKFPEETKELKDIWFVSAGAAWPVADWVAVCAQVYAHASAYNFLGDEMKKPVAAIVLGPRFEILPETTLEIGGGVGFTDASSDWFVGVQLNHVIGW
jgi:hypothetical protein